MSDNVKPTRMELLNTKQRVILAEKGHKILKQKRDALVMEFFSIVKKASNLRSQLDAEMMAAYKSLAVARAFHTDLYIKSNAFAAQEAPHVALTAKNIMGVRITAISTPHFAKQSASNVSGTSAKYDEAQAHFRKALELVLAVAETETAIKRLLQEIEKTNRRVNALEYNVTPKLKATIKMIAGHLNRLEAEQFFALKVTKRRLNKAAEQNEN